MSTANDFATADPIDLELRLHRAVVELRAGDGTDPTTVEVAPTDPDDPTDVWAAGHTTVERHGDRIVVTAPEQRELGDRQSIDLTVHLPSRSRLDLDGARVELRADGVLDRCRIGVAAGSLRLDRLGPSTVGLKRGDVEVAAVDGDLSLSLASGAARVDSVDGDLDLQVRSGDVTVGSVTGSTRAEAAAGALRLGSVGGALLASTTSGGISVERIGTGVDATTASGAIELGVATGAAAFLDLDSRSGRVRSDLPPTDRPGDGEQAVTIRASTRSGDITVRRAG